MAGSLSVRMQLPLLPLTHWLTDVVENRLGDPLRCKLLVQSLEAHACPVGDEDGVVKEEHSVGHHPEMGAQQEENNRKLGFMLLKGYSNEG